MPISATRGAADQMRFDIQTIAARNCEDRGGDSGRERIVLDSHRFATLVLSAL